MVRVPDDVRGFEDEIRIPEGYDETVCEAVMDYVVNGENAARLSKEIFKVVQRKLSE